MEPQITLSERWIEVDTTAGTEIVRYDDHSGLPEALILLATDLTLYVEGTILDDANGVPRIRVVRGYGARLSMPGCLDRTDWTVHESPEAARAYLLETFCDCPEGEDCSVCSALREARTTS